MAKSENNNETIILTLINLPRVKLDLLEFKDEQSQYFVLRKMRFFAHDNVKAHETRINRTEAKLMAQAILHLLADQEESLKPATE